MSVAFSPDGQKLARASWDSTIRLWNPHNGQHIKTLTEHRGGVASIVFSPDGQTLASGGRDRLVYLLPNDRSARPERVTALRQLIKDAQQFFADEMERHGLGTLRSRRENRYIGWQCYHSFFRRRLSSGTLHKVFGFYARSG